MSDAQKGMKMQEHVAGSEPSQLGLALSNARDAYTILSRQGHPPCSQCQGAAWAEIGYLLRLLEDGR